MSFPPEFYLNLTGTPLLLLLFLFTRRGRERKPEEHVALPCEEDVDVWWAVHWVCRAAGTAVLPR